MSEATATRIRCPHCGNKLQLIQQQQPLAEITCDGCGSTIVVDTEATRSIVDEVEELPEKIGRFPVVSVLGQGGFGVVYKGWDEALARYVAIKVPRSGYFSTVSERQRFLREARNAGQLQHPGIVKVHDVAETSKSGFPFIVSDFIEGLTLSDLIETPTATTFRFNNVLITPNQNVYRIRLALAGGFDDFREFFQRFLLIKTNFAGEPGQEIRDFFHRLAMAKPGIRFDRRYFSPALWRLSIQCKIFSGNSGQISKYFTRPGFVSCLTCEFSVLLVKVGLDRTTVHFLQHGRTLMPGFLFGLVADDGSIANAGSTGWTSSKIDLGQYHVEFDAALETVPTVVLSCHGDDNNTIATMEITRTYFVVHTKQAAAAFDDAAFNFIAVTADS